MHPQHKVWEILSRHFPGDKADFIVSLIAPYLKSENVEPSNDARDAQLEATVRQLVANNDALHARNARLVAALESIAANSCCDKCQEAALVARKALANQQSTEKP